MALYYPNPYGAGAQTNNQFQNQPQTPFYPQAQLLSPTGNVYVTNTMQEANNVPVGIGTTVALCLPENLMYIKTAQNGIPIVKQYQLTEIEPKTISDVEKENATLEKENAELKKSLAALEEKVRIIDAQYRQSSNKGGASEWAL